MEGVCGGMAAVMEVGNEGRAGSGLQGGSSSSGWAAGGGGRGRGGGGGGGSALEDAVKFLTQSTRRYFPVKAEAGERRRTASGVGAGGGGAGVLAPGSPMATYQSVPQGGADGGDSASVGCFGFVKGGVADDAEAGEPVVLNIYDLSPLNRYLKWAGLGAFHSGVEVAGREYAFCGHPHAFSGVVVMRPKRVPRAVLKESVLLGRTTLSPREVHARVVKLGEEWPGNKYTLTGRNCNHFAEALSTVLLGRNVFPHYVNRMAHITNRVQCLLPAELVNPPTLESVERDEAVMESTPGALASAR